MVESSVGVNWGTLSTHRIAPHLVVDLLKVNKIQKVKLFDTDPTSLRALMGSGIQVMVGIPNELLAALASSVVNSDLWIKRSVSMFVGKGKVDIRYVDSFRILLFRIDFNWVNN